MAHLSLATRIWGPAASALRRHPGAAVPLPPPAVAARSRSVGTIGNQADPLNIKRTEQEPVSLIELQYLLLELKKAGKIAQQRAVELEQVRYQKKKARMIYGFTLAALPSMAVYIAKRKAAVNGCTRHFSSP